MFEKRHSILLLLFIVLLTIIGGCYKRLLTNSSEVCDRCSNKICEEVFYFNREIKVSNATKLPYMRTCGLTVEHAKCLMDIYSKDMSVDQNNVNIIYDELAITDRILSKHNIPYFIIAGTLLGAIRNGGLIPNDDDADIAIHERYESALKELAPLFEEAGYSLDSKVFAWGGLKVLKKNAGSTGLDIFPMKERLVDGKIVLAYAREKAFTAWPKETFSIEALKNIESIKFGHLVLSSVSLEHAFENLNNSYGKDWYTTTYKIWNHVSSKPGRRKKEILLPTEYYYLKHGLYK